MTWTLLFILAAIVFFNRYFFLEPNIRLRLPVFIEKMLGFSAPCLLMAICTPIIFFNGSEIRRIPLDPYFLGAVMCVFLACLSRKILLNLVLSMLFFYLMIYVLNR
ncbi:AzlD domain-containing protein [Acinetobacter stercoris]|uniref:Branched-chain amino acid transport protein (AzlD) n=1 Tax=Acinetobacter stercoris TaxID=2126983 RepID=A0A2U3N251_9GAMM|nr:AzlD domain-containing protein [Acinetobacter stercoris]SPL71770.1 Branched-chain amino acid transport protein (AzlD) [Acinetobacter stercoris]